MSQEVDDFLAHHGVKGMHWGVHRSRAELEKKASDHTEKFKYHQAMASDLHRRAQDIYSNGLKSKEFENQYGKDAATQNEWKFYAKNGMTKADAMESTYNDLRSLSNYHQKVANSHSKKAAKYQEKAKEATHSGFAIDDEAPDDFLEHHGVKGMHWGVHRARSQAKSDAKEFTKAKLSYGQGAGTRRKLINAKVEQRSKNPEYKKAFDQFVAEQNLDKRAAQAKREHNVKAVGRGTYKTAKGVHRSLTGGFGSVSMASAGIAAAAVYAHKSGLDQQILSSVKTVATNQHTKNSVNAWLRSQGMM